MHADRATVVGSVQGQQAGLQGDESRRGAERGSFGACATPVSASSPLGTSSAGSGMRLSLAALIQRACTLVGRTSKSDAEQAVDDEAEVRSRSSPGHDRDRRARRHAARAVAASPACARRRPARRQRRRRKTTTQVSGRATNASPPLLPGPGQHQHARSTVRQHVARERARQRVLHAPSAAALPSRRSRWRGCPRRDRSARNASADYRHRFAFRGAVNEAEPLRAARLDSGCTESIH